jgi:molybdate/tungstate transport system substrate-binding protein
MIVLTLLMLCSILNFTSCSGEKSEKIQVRVLCAGSLILPFNEVEKAYEVLHPDVDILTEGHGSIQVIRHVTELYEEADIIAVADYSLIPMMMYDVKIPETDEYYTDWYIKFATNTLGIAYTKDSKYANEITENNWFDILKRPDIKLGLADPRLDACGYRALMLLTLAESYYKNENILGSVIGEFNPPIELLVEDGITTIIVPEIVNPLNERIVLRGSSIRLLALLESGDIDYAFEYRSVAEQHNLEFLELPPEINLGFQDKSELYQQVKIKLDFQRFSSVQPEFSGLPIIYGITIPANAPHPKEAQEYIDFLLGEDGQQIMNNYRQPIIAPEIDRKNP